MGCLIVLIGLFSPRLALFFIAIFSNLLARAFDHHWAAPLLGFFLLPWTTLVYALTWSGGHRVAGFDWFLVAIAFVIDLGSYMGSDRARHRR